MKEPVIEKAYAKINLHLDVTGLREDGYHDVCTVMQSVSLCDIITISNIEKSNTEPHFSVSCNTAGVPCDESNLAVRAAHLFCRHTGIALSGHINIEKHIPMAAGMAGGSTDGAAVLRGLNRAAGAPISTAELCALGAALGADIPFCTVGGTKYADGRGDNLHDFPKMPDCSIVIACEGEGVSTPWGYRLLDETHNNFSKGAYTPRNTAELESALTRASIEDTARSIYNIFEAPVLAHRPIAARIRSLLLSEGALGAMMSGSGPSVFGIFASDEEAENAAKALKSQGFKPYICKPV